MKDRKAEINSLCVVLEIVIDVLTQSPNISVVADVDALYGAKMMLREIRTEIEKEPPDVTTLQQGW